MMAFRMTRGGYLANASYDERQMMSGLARDVIFILGSDINREIERREELEAADDPLAALEAEFAGWDESRWEDGRWDDDGWDDGANDSSVHGDSVTDASASSFGMRGGKSADPDPDTIRDPDASPYDDRHMPLDDALEKLLPDMSEDPEAANELRKLTEESVAGAKIENLVTLYEGLAAVPDESDRIEITNDQAGAWMSAMNDIRLVLSARLEINDDDAANAVYERAGLFTSSYSRHDGDLPEIETPHDMMAVLYAMITWWQESLVGAVRNKSLRR